MSKTMNEVITRLTETNVISSRPDLASLLIAINRYSDNETLQAFLLGSFFKHKLDPDKLAPEDKNLLVDTIKKHNLDSFFYLKSKPHGETLGTIIYILAFGGPLIITGGIIQLINGSFSYGLGTKYLVPVIREGGFFVLVGIGFTYAGILRLRRDRRKSILIKRLTKPAE